MEITPLDGKVAIRVLSLSERSAGGIIIPENSRKAALSFGEVVAVGRCRRSSDGTAVAFQVTPGDCVMFHPHRGEDGWVGDEQLRVINEEHIYGIVDREVAETMRPVSPRHVLGGPQY